MLLVPAPPPLELVEAASMIKCGWVLRYWMGSAALATDAKAVISLWTTVGKIQHAFLISKLPFISKYIYLVRSGTLALRKGKTKGLKGKLVTSWRIEWNSETLREPPWKKMKYTFRVCCLDRPNNYIGRDHTEIMSLFYREGGWSIWKWRVIGGGGWAYKNMSGPR